MRASAAPDGAGADGDLLVPPLEAVGYCRVSLAGQREATAPDRSGNQGVFRSFTTRESGTVTGSSVFTALASPSRTSCSQPYDAS